MLHFNFLPNKSIIPAPIVSTSIYMAVAIMPNPANNRINGNATQKRHNAVSIAPPVPCVLYQVG